MKKLPVVLPVHSDPCFLYISQRAEHPLEEKLCYNLNSLPISSLNEPPICLDDDRIQSQQPINLIFDI